jgi:hypothetical protein
VIRAANIQPELKGEDHQGTLTPSKQVSEWAENWAAIRSLARYFADRGGLKPLICPCSFVSHFGTSGTNMSERLDVAHGARIFATRCSYASHGTSMQLSPPRCKQVCAIPVNLNDATTCQIPDQAGRSNVFVSVWETTAEQFGCIPAEFGCTVRPWANNKLLTVLYEKAPPMGGMLNGRGLCWRMLTPRIHSIGVS